MKKLMVIALFAVMVLLYGCIEYEEHLVLNADGSGTLTVKYAMSEQMAAMAGQQDAEKGQLPMDKKKIEKLFAGKDDLKLSNVNVSIEDGKRVISFTLVFDSIEKLQKSDFAPFKESLKFARNEDGSFSYERKMSAGSDMGGPQMKPVEQTEPGQGEKSKMPEGTEEMGEEMMKGMMKGMMGGMAPKFTYKLTLPAKIAETNADSHEGRNAEWKIEINMEKPDEMKDKVFTARTLVGGESGFPLLPVIIVAVVLVAGLLLLLLKRGGSS